MYLKYKEMKPETILALQFVEECQDEYNGICTINQYVQILLDNSLITTPPYMEDKTAYSNLAITDVFKGKMAIPFQNSFEDQVKSIEFGKFLIHEDGKKVNGNFFMTEYTKPFKLKESATKELKNYNPWWTK